PVRKPSAPETMASVVTTARPNSTSAARLRAALRTDMMAAEDDVDRMVPRPEPDPAAIWRRNSCDFIAREGAPAGRANMVKARLSGRYRGQRRATVSRPRAFFQITANKAAASRSVKCAERT